MKKFAKTRKSGKTRPSRPQLTPEIQALYFQCLAGKTLHLSPADQSLIVQIFNRQFPALPRAAREAQHARRNWNRIAWWWGVGLATLGIALFLIFGCAKSVLAGNLAQKYQAVQEALNEAVTVDEARRDVARREDVLQQQQAEFDKVRSLARQQRAYETQLAELQQRQQQQQDELAAYQQQLQQAYDDRLRALQQQEQQEQHAELMQQLDTQKDRAALAEMKLAAVNAELLKAAQDAGDEQERQAWQQGTEHFSRSPQIVTDGRAAAVVETAPRRIVNTASWPRTEPGLSDRHTTITVIQPTPKPQPLVIQQARAEIRNRTTGTDHENSLLLPEGIAEPEQLELLEAQIDGNNQRFQQRLELEGRSLSNAFWLQALKEVKSLILWGLIVSLPFVFLSFVIAKNIWQGWTLFWKEQAEQTLRLEQEQSRQLKTLDNVVTGGKEL